MLFFGINCILFIFGIYQAYKKNEFRLNTIIMNSYYLLFHISFLLMDIFTKNSTDMRNVYEYLGIISTALLVVGALHETLFFFFMIFYFVYKLFRELNKVGTGVKAKN
jgi:hypothetical protein